MGVVIDPATGFAVVEVVPFKQNIENIEVLLITDDAESSPTKGGLLNLSAQDVLDITDRKSYSSMFRAILATWCISVTEELVRGMIMGANPMPTGFRPSRRRLKVSI